MGNRGCHPVIKYCIPTPTIFETIQYNAKPVGKLKENTAIKSGIIHSIMVWLPCCLASATGVMVIFCWTQVETKTSTGMMTTVAPVGLSARSIPKNLAFSGAASYIGKNPNHE